MNESVVYLLLVVGGAMLTLILGYVRILDQSLRKLRISLFESKVVAEPPSPERGTLSTIAQGIQIATQHPTFGHVVNHIRRKASV